MGCIFPMQGLFMGMIETRATGATIGSQEGEYLFNGAKVLFENGYFATCVLKAIGYFVRIPDSGKISTSALARTSNGKGQSAGEALQNMERSLGSPGLQQKLVQTRMNNSGSNCRSSARMAPEDSSCSVEGSMYPQGMICRLVHMA